MAPRDNLLGKNLCITYYGPYTPPGELFPDFDMPAQYPPYVKYCVGQKERCPTTERIHFQLYVEVDPRQRLSTLRRWLPRLHVENRNGTQARAIEYVTKEETRMEEPFEYGEKSTIERAGQRTDLDDAIVLLKRGGLRLVAQEMPSAFVKFSSGLERLAEALSEKPTDKDFVPRPWQKDLMDVVLGPANDRTIVWVYDEDGNKGKSRLTKHLVFEHNAILLTGKLADMAFTYNSEPIVIFDVPRTAVEHMKHLFTFAEMLKNGMVHSTKYVPKVKYFNPPHVIFMANIPAPESTWSSDRLMLVTLV